MTNLPSESVSPSNPAKKWWLSPTVVGIVFFILHGVLFVFSVVGVESNPNSMIWGSWALLDFPLGYFALYLAYEIGGHGFVAIAIMVGLGGLQWFIWGFLLQFVVQQFVRPRKRKL